MNNVKTIRIQHGYQSPEQARDIAVQKLRAAGYAVDVIGQFGSTVYINGFRCEDGSLNMFNEAEAQEVIELYRDQEALSDAIGDFNESIQQNRPVTCTRNGNTAYCY